MPTICARKHLAMVSAGASAGLSSAGAACAHINMPMRPFSKVVMAVSGVHASVGSAESGTVVLMRK